jgi:hypothetical protein
VSEVALVTRLGSTGPNPFRGTTSVEFSVGGEDAAKVLVEVFDVAGRRVSRLVDGVLPPGTYRVLWRGRADGGGRVAGGIYFLRMTCGDYVKVQKVGLLR